MSWSPAFMLHPEIVARVRATPDVNRLSRWIKLAAEAGSLADFQAGMGE